MSELKLTQPPGWAQPVRDSDSFLRSPATLLRLTYLVEDAQAQPSWEQEATPLPGAGQSFFLKICLQEANKHTRDTRASLQLVQSHPAPWGQGRAQG